MKQPTSQEARSSSAASKQMPRRARRKDARPGEIIAAATALFGEKGYAATRLEEVGRRAGVSKGTVYVYFETKEALFRAVARSALASRLATRDEPFPVSEGPLTQALPKLISHFLDMSSADKTYFLVRMVIAEAHNFPDIARIWHDEVVLPMIDLAANLISQGQTRGEVRAGDPRLIAFSVLGPLQMTLLYQSTFASIEKYEPNIDTLSEQHTQILLHGLLQPAR